MSKFNFKKVTGKKYRKWNDWDIDDFIIGEFVGTYIDRYKHRCYEFEIIETNLKDLNEGDIFGMNRTGSLEKIYDDGKFQKGDTVQVIFEGKDIINNPKSEFNGKEFIKLDIQVDDSTRKYSSIESPIDDSNMV